jgi:amino acid permease
MEYIETKDETRLRNIATIILFVGIGISVFMFFSMTFVQIAPPLYEYSSKPEYVFKPIGLIQTVITLISSIGVWGLIRVICNISISLKEINENSNYSKER